MAAGKDSDPYERFFRPRPGEGADPDPDPDPTPHSSSASDSSPTSRSAAGAGAARTPGSTRSARRAARRAESASAATGVSAAATPGIAKDARGSGGGAGGRPGGAQRSRMFLLVSGVMSLVVLLASGGAWALQDYLLGRIKRIDAFGGLTNRPAGGPEGALNILVAGVDRREGISPAVQRKLRLGRQEGQRSDTMMVIHLSEKHDKATVLSLPRDSLVTIPAHRGAGGQQLPEQRNKLNAAFSWGGHKLAIQTIERNTGIRIDHYVEVNFLGFIKVVDALGGVEVCTPTQISDSKSGLTLSPGKHVVDGATALAYVRTRYSLTGGSDLGRVRRQQQFMASMIHRALSTRTMTDPGKLSAFLNASLAAIRLDERLSRETVARLAAQLKNVSTDNVTFATVPMTEPGQMIKDLGSVAQWDPQRAGPLFSKIKNDQPITSPPASAPARPSAPPSPGGPGGALTVPPDRIEVRVLNGTTTPGLGAKAANGLRRAGFGIEGIPQNAPVRDVSRTVIQYGPGRRDSAETLLAAVPGARLRESTTLGQQVQVVVGSSWSGAKAVEVSGPQTGAVGGQGAPGTPEASTATQSACK